MRLREALFLHMRHVLEGCYSINEAAAMHMRLHFVNVRLHSGGRGLDGVALLFRPGHRLPLQPSYHEAHVSSTCWYLHADDDVPTLPVLQRAKVHSDAFTCGLRDETAFDLEDLGAFLRAQVEVHFPSHRHQQVAHRVYEDRANKASVRDEAVGCLTGSSQHTKQFAVYVVAEAEGANGAREPLVLIPVSLQSRDGDISVGGLPVREEHHVAEARRGAVGASAQRLQAVEQPLPDVGATTFCEGFNRCARLKLACFVHDCEWEDRQRHMIKPHHGEAIRGPERLYHRLHAVLCNVEHRQAVSLCGTTSC
mmetsp:Transcript_69154/g.152993  ORF Transcript_69154/g.152993 Transcript_69154/m.152993 type:complete len:309 (+) Transcript_69154:868-1794(+)